MFFGVCLGFLEQMCIWFSWLTKKIAARQSSGHHPIIGAWLQELKGSFSLLLSWDNSLLLSLDTGVIVLRPLGLRDSTPIAPAPSSSFQRPQTGSYTTDSLILKDSDSDWIILIHWNITVYLWLQTVIVRLLSFCLLNQFL